jgi:hypothetical protein
MPTNTYDASYFEDLDQLDALLQDSRAQDLIVVSSREDAIALIETFRLSTAISPWIWLDREAIANRLIDLVNEPRAICQGGLNLCGPAALLCMWNGRDPVGFATYATELYDTGTGYIGSLEISPSVDILETDFNVISEQANTWAADWMLLGAIRNSLNVWWQPTWVGDPDQELAGLTRPEELAEWLSATGIYETVENEANWVVEKGIPHALNLRQQAGRDIALLINTNLIKAAAENPKLDRDFLLSLFPSHFVVAVNEVLLDLQETHVQLSLWTWGDTSLMLKVPKQAFVENYYGAVIATLPEQIDQFA